MIRSIIGVSAALVTVAQAAGPFRNLIASVGCKGNDAVDSFANRRLRPELSDVGEDEQPEPSSHSFSCTPSKPDNQGAPPVCEPCKDLNLNPRLGLPTGLYHDMFHCRIKANASFSSFRYLAARRRALFGEEDPSP